MIREAGVELHRRGSRKVHWPASKLLVAKPDPPRATGGTPSMALMVAITISLSMVISARNQRRIQRRRVHLPRSKQGCGSARGPTLQWMVVGKSSPNSHYLFFYVHEEVMHGSLPGLYEIDGNSPNMLASITSLAPRVRAYVTRKRP